MKEIGPAGRILYICYAFPCTLLGHPAPLRHEQVRHLGVALRHGDVERGGANARAQLPVRPSPALAARAQQEPGHLEAPLGGRQVQGRVPLAVRRLGVDVPGVGPAQDQLSGGGVANKSSQFYHCGNFG